MHKRGACVLWCLLTSPSLCPCHLRIVCRASTVPLSNLSELRIWTLCWELGVLCAIVHPGRWIMWLTSPLKACQQTPFLSASLHQCMFGSYRRKATRILHTNPYLQKLALACDGSHAHEPWRAPAQNRQKDSSFPPMLCKAYADAVVSQLVACGVAEGTCRGPLVVVAGRSCCHIQPTYGPEAPSACA